jgi:tetratricopeptide (TPR) repeat protein
MITRAVRLAAALLILLLGSSCLYSQASNADLQRDYEAGEQALSEHRYADAERAYEKLERLSPDTAEVFGRLGLVYFQERKFDKAVSALRRAMKLKPGLPNTDILLAMSLSELGRYSEALPGLEKGFGKSTESVLRRLSGLQLQRAYTGLHRDRQAMEVALELNKLYPKDPEVLYETSRVYANFAYLTLVKLSQVAPDSVWRHEAAGEAYESQGDYSLALTEYRQVLKLAPDRPGIHFRVGRTLLRQGQKQNVDDTPQALKEFEQELELDPTNANAAYEMGETYRKSGQLDKAQRFFDQALKYYPDFEEAHLGMAGVLLASGEPGRALAELQRASALNPDDEVTYYRLSQAYKSLGDAAGQEKALETFRRLRAEKPNRQELSPAAEVTKQEIDSEPAQAGQNR